MAIDVGIMTKDLDLPDFLTGGGLCEELGFDSYGSGDHIAFGAAMPEILTGLSAVAARTSRIRMGTGVYVLPWRHPVQIASQVATLDRISGGRFNFGVGVGETEDEFRAFGVPLNERGRRTDETIDCLRLLWSGERVSYTGKHLSLDQVKIRLTPLQSPLPIYIGGRSDAAIKRAAQRAEGYTGIWISTRRIQEAREKIQEWAAEAGRDPASIRVGIQVWACVDDDRIRARACIAESMSSFYGIPFEKFERYVPYGSADEVQGFLQGYQEAGVDHMNLVPIGERPLEQMRALAEIIRNLGWLASGEGVASSRL